MEEFEHRTWRAQRLMARDNLDALLLSTEPEVRWFTGFFSQFWTSPTRPWFAVVPAEGKPIAVIPTIGEAGMRETWLDDVRTWPAPRPAKTARHGSPCGSVQLPWWSSHLTSCCDIMGAGGSVS